MDGTKRCAGRLVTPSSTVLIDKRIKTNSDAQMSSMPMKCGAHPTSVESLLSRNSGMRETKGTMIRNGLSRTTSQSSPYSDELMDRSFSFNNGY